jgi:hypothetical protein
MLHGGRRGATTGRGEGAEGDGKAGGMGRRRGRPTGATTPKNNDARQGNCGNFPKTIIYVNNNHDYDDG